MYFDCITPKAQYPIPLSTVLECLAICEYQQHVPPIEATWWQDTQHRYPNMVIIFNDMKHVTQENAIHCEQCDDPIMFNISVQNDDDLVLDFMSMLTILSTAEEYSSINTLPDEWWLTLEHIYGQLRIRT